MRRPSSAEAYPAEAGNLGYGELLGRSEPAPRIERSGEDLYLMCTGGTTGMPKGVMFRHSDFAAQILEILGPEHGMHGTGMWLGAVFSGFVGGATSTSREC